MFVCVPHADGDGDDDNDDDNGDSSAGCLCCSIVSSFANYAIYFRNIREE